MRRTVLTRSIAPSNDAIASTPLASELAIRYASAKSILSTSYTFEPLRHGQLSLRRQPCARRCLLVARPLDLG